MIDAFFLVNKNRTHSRSGPCSKLADRCFSCRSFSRASWNSAPAEMCPSHGFMLGRWAPFAICANHQGFCMLIHPAGLLSCARAFSLAVQHAGCAEPPLPAVWRGRQGSCLCLGRLRTLLQISGGFLGSQSHEQSVLGRLIEMMGRPFSHFEALLPLFGSWMAALCVSKRVSAKLF